MSSSKSDLKENIKFTRGDKCLFVHLIITFCMIILMIFIYFVHLCWVNHPGNEIFTVSRRSPYVNSLPRPMNTSSSEYQSVGVLYLNVTPTKIICNTLLIRQMWSLAPAHCVAMHSDPDLAYFLPTWKIMYKIHYNYIETGIMQSVIHNQFNREDFNNNIGLLKHIDLIPASKYIAPINIDVKNVLLARAGNMVIVGWTWSSHLRDGFLNNIFTNVPPMTSEKCHNAISPILKTLRYNEFCVQLNKKGDVYVDHGAVYVMNFKMIGFFSWGDKRGIGVPLIFINIVDYREWFENIIDL